MERSPRQRWADAGRALLLLVLPIALWIALPARPPPPARAARAARTDSANTAADRRRASAATDPKTNAPARAATVVSAPVPPGEGIEGEVQDPEGKPAAGAAITCLLDERDFAAESDASGKFRVPVAAAGCKLSARKAGFAPSDDDVLRAGASNRLRLQPPTGISGLVVDEGGAPVPIYWIAVESFAPASAAADAGAKPGRKIALEITDQDGAFAWSDLAPGRYDLAVSAQHHPFARAAGVEVRAGAVTTGVRIALSKGTTIVGKVTDAKTHEPLIGAMVFADMGLELGLKALPAFSDDGAYRLEGAPAVPFDLHVARAGYEEHVTPGVRGAVGGEPVRVDVALRRLGEAP